MSPRRAALTALAALAALAACRRDVAVVAQPRSAPRPDPVEDAGNDDPAAALAATVVDTYGHIGMGNTSAYLEVLASDQPIALIGVTSDSVVVGRSPRAAARDRRLFRGLMPTVLAKNLEVHRGRDGSVGWVFDELSYRVVYLERTASIPIRQTSVWVRDFDRWVEVVEHWSYALPVADVRQMAASGRLPSPARFAAARPTAPGQQPGKEAGQPPGKGGGQDAGQKAGAEPEQEVARLVVQLHNGSDAERAALMSDRPEVLILLPHGEYRGAAARAAPSLAALFGPDSTVALREVRASRARSGDMAWLVANLALRTSVNDEVVEVGLRGTYLVEHVAGSWRLVQAHVSAPVTAAELARRVFGEE